MNISTYEDYITGFWIADSEFCETTEISDMLVWFGPAESTGSRSCYLVINPDIANCAFELKYWRGWGGPTIGTYHISAECNFPEFAEDPPMPATVDIAIDMITGQMRISSGDKVYAKLIKSHSITNAADAESDE